MTEDYISFWYKQLGRYYLLTKFVFIWTYASVQKFQLLCFLHQAEVLFLNQNSLNSWINNFFISISFFFLQICLVLFTVSYSLLPYYVSLFISWNTVNILIFYLESHGSNNWSLVLRQNILFSLVFWSFLIVNSCALVPCVNPLRSGLKFPFPARITFASIRHLRVPWIT